MTLPQRKHVSKIAVFWMMMMMMMEAGSTFETSVNLY
jgi:hypothetical protein